MLFFYTHIGLVCLILCLGYTMYLHTINGRKKTNKKKKKPKIKPKLGEFSICTRVLYLSDIILKEHKIWGRLICVEVFLYKKK